MILPVVAYGHPLLKRRSEEIDEDYPGLDELIHNMFETMHHATGVGLAAPQVNLSIRLFIVDATPFAKEHPETENFKKVFINPQIIDEDGEVWTYQEGCLSIPDIHEDVSRKSKIRIQYYDENFNFHEEEFDGILGRIIQHEYDHLEGVLFVDKVSTLRKAILRKKLNDIAKGKIKVDYKMIFPMQKKKNKIQHG